MESDASSTASGGRRSNANERPWTLPFVLVAAIAVAGVFLAIRRGPPEDSVESRGGWTPEVSAPAQSVSLAIDFGNGARRDFAALPWSQGMTVGDALMMAQDFRPGVTFAQQGEGEMALLTTLDGVANDPAIGRFWMYDVDGKAGDVSFARQPLNPGQKVNWVYTNKLNGE